jgi:hypothetical protein
MADMLAKPYLNSDGESFYFKRVAAKNISGLPLYIDLAAREIPLDIYEGKKCMPLQTFNDIFFTNHAINILFNSEAVFVVPDGQIPADLVDEYYSIERTERSEALADFTAKELCLLLELYYGLKDEHGVLVGFDVYLEHAGLLDDLSSTDPDKAVAALASLMFGYLADKHSSVTKPSPYTGKQAVDLTNVKIDTSIRRYLAQQAEFAQIRAEIMTDGVKGYYEDGNTAYITFDSFTIDSSRFEDYENGVIPEVNDTMGLIIYAHSQITREGSPIENVVLDLSCNGGGTFDSAAYVVAWMLGYCEFHITNPITNGFSTCTYMVDVNLDHEFDERDTISDKNLYCIISPLSFSCGNLVPALLKESGMVTLIGDTSGGGACSVQIASTADGSIFNISSPKKISVVSNGSYYTVDRGIEPHAYIRKPENYFKRDELTDYINAML